MKALSMFAYILAGIIFFLDIGNAMVYFAEGVEKLRNPNYLMKLQSFDVWVFIGWLVVANILFFFGIYLGKIERRNEKNKTKKFWR